MVLVSDVEVCKTDAGEAMEVVCKFFYFEIIILTCILILTEAVARRCSVKRCSWKFRKIYRKTKSLLDWLRIQEGLCVSWLTNFCEGMCLFKSWLVHGLLFLLFYDNKNFTKVLSRSSWIKIVHYHCIQSICRYPNLETCFCVVFITPLYGRSFFPNITLLKLHIKI